ncbi:hypothetical protein KJ616_02535 [Patescibacteria group bacterium]|nr:hypothetical protein [Patescibacteria group bacterium]
MKLKKAMLWGVTVAIISYLVILILQTSYNIWKPLLEILEFQNTVLKWSVACALTLVVLAIIGYAIIILAHPFKGIMYRILGLKARQAKSVVLVKWGGIWFLGWLAGRTQVDEDTLYRVIVPSAPLPVSGQLMLVPRHRIIFTNLTVTEHLAQLTSMGFGDFPESLNKCPDPLLKNNRRRGRKSQTAPPG